MQQGEKCNSGHPELFAALAAGRLSSLACPDLRGSRRVGLCITSWIAAMTAAALARIWGEDATGAAERVELTHASNVV